jgi:hypothetical protein
MRVLATRRAFLKSAAFIAAAPALLASSRDARAAVALTLGHGAAPGNPRTVGDGAHQW